MNSHQIREQDPLKQGLKLCILYILSWRSFYSRARSTKTRIETLLLRERVKILTGIREQDPLKQGLKPFIVHVSSRSEEIREQDPLKQGLKQCKISFNPTCNHIREQDPLKQGLKLNKTSIVF